MRLVGGCLKDRHVARVGFGGRHRSVGIGLVEPKLDPRTSWPRLGQKRGEGVVGEGRVGMQLKDLPAIAQDREIAAGLMGAHAEHVGQKGHHSRHIPHEKIEAKARKRTPEIGGRDIVVIHRPSRRGE